MTSRTQPERLLSHHLRISQSLSQALGSRENHPYQPIRSLSTSFCKTMYSLTQRFVGHWTIFQTLSATRDSRAMRAIHHDQILSRVAKFSRREMNYRLSRKWLPLFVSPKVRAGCAQIETSTAYNLDE